MFRVEWLQEAVDELASIWIGANTNLRQKITVAANILDQELQADPFRQSESRHDEDRVLFAYPLAVQFEIELQKRIVWVLHVWRFRRRGE
jgi:hypothetical protein